MTEPRHSSDILGRKRRGVLSMLFDPRPLKTRMLDLEYLSWKIKTKYIYKKVNPAVPFPKMILDADINKLLHTIVEEAEYGSALNVSQLRFFIPCRFLTLRKQILYANMCLSRYLSL